MFQPMNLSSAYTYGRQKYVLQYCEDNKADVVVSESDSNRKRVV